MSDFTFKTSDSIVAVAGTPFLCIARLQYRQCDEYRCRFPHDESLLEQYRRANRNTTSACVGVNPRCLPKYSASHPFLLMNEVNLKLVKRKKPECTSGF